MTVSVREVTPEGDEYIRVGKLYLVDLAGSENITRWARACERRPAWARFYVGSTFGQEDAC